MNDLIAQLWTEHEAARATWLKTFRQLADDLARRAPEMERQSYNDTVMEVARARQQALVNLRYAEQELYPLLHPQPEMTAEQRMQDYINRNKRLFHKCLCDVEPNFTIDASNKELLRELYYWAIGMQELTPLHCGRGLLLHGTVGSGKTTLMSALRLFLRDVTPLDGITTQPGFGLIGAPQLAMRYAEKGSEALKELENTPYCIDELGRESRSSHYGTATNVVAQAVQLCYDRGVRVHFTTNLNGEELQNAYGTHVYDRLMETCNIVEVSTNESRRNPVASQPRAQMQELPFPA